MRILKSFLVLMVLAGSVNAEDDKDPFDPEAGKRPERKVIKLPKSVTHRELNPSSHEYTIAGIYEGAVADNHSAREEGGEKDPFEGQDGTYEVLIPNCLEMKFDFKKRTATFTTSKELSYSDLAYAIDDMARLGGDVPYWLELEARDLEPTKDYDRLRFEVKEVKEKAPAQLAWFWLPKDRELKIPLSLPGGEIGTLMAVPSTAHCMAHSKFALRVLDPEGKVVWKDEMNAYASVKMALSEDGELPTHKIWMIRDDHGEEMRFTIVSSIAPEAEQK